MRPSELACDKRHGENRPRFIGDDTCYIGINMNKIARYYPKLYIINNEVIDLGLITHISVEQEIESVGKYVETRYFEPKLVANESKTNIRFYVLIKVSNSSFSIKYYLTSKKDAEKFMKKILKLGKIKVLT